MTGAERADAVYDLSAAWKFAGEIFPYFEEKEIDWDGAYQTYLRRVLCVESEREFHLLMAEFLNLLGDGHTDYRFPAKLADEAGYLPFTLMHQGGAWFVKEVFPGQEAFLMAKVLSVNGVGVEEFLKDCFRYIYHVENFADWWKLKGIMPFLLKRSGNAFGTSKGIMRFDLEQNAPSGLVGIRQDAPAEKPVMRVYEENGQKVLYVRMDNFVYPGVGEEVLAALLQNPGTSGGNSAYTGVILDIRRNIGGMTAYAAEVAKLFFSGEFCACRKKTRMMKGIDVSSASQYEKMKEEQIRSCIQNGLCTEEEVERCLRTAKNKNYYEYKDSFGAPGHRAVFDGPLILLTGRGTVSAAEDFTAMFKSTKRATLMGEATFGSTGTPLLKRLRLGGSMRICSVGYRLLDGTKFIGKGIEPDIFVEGDMGAYESGKDVVLEQALKRFGVATEGMR